MLNLRQVNNGKKFKAMDVKYNYTEKDQEILNQDFVVVSYMVIGGDKQTTQIYVGADCPDKSYLNTMSIKLTGNLKAQAIPIAFSRMKGHEINKLYGIDVRQIVKAITADQEKKG